MNTLLVFDYATTGSDPIRDRPVEFACIRLDMELNVIGTPTTLHCKPASDHLSDPAACLIHGVTPQFCEQVGLPERYFVDAIHRQLSTPGTVSFGYNSIAFDDEITRFMFWRNLMDPYAHEWKNGCGRWDVIELVRATHALRPETLEWPRDEQGNVSFRLESLAHLNGLLHESTHDTLSNVYATIALARFIRERQPQLYAHMFSLHDKSMALHEMTTTQKRPFIYISPDTSVAAGVRLMFPIGQHPTNRNEVVAWDLANDPRQLLDIDAESMRRRMFTRYQERPQDFEPMPLMSIAANKSPAVFRNPQVLSRERAAELGIDVGAALANVPVMMGVLDTMDWPRLLQVVYARDPVDCDAEEALYEGFLGNHDRQALDQLRTMDPAALASIQPVFSDPRLDELFLRYKARHYPESLSQRELDKWEEHRFRKLITGYSGSRTVAMVRESVVRWRHTLSASGGPIDPGTSRILDDVLAYTNDIAAVIDPYEITATAPVPETEVPAADAAQPVTVPVQPDLFGGTEATSTVPRVRRRRR
jgi:exodeoxyribonuclease-1